MVLRSGVFWYIGATFGAYRLSSERHIGVETAIRAAFPFGVPHADVTPRNYNETICLFLF